MEARAGIICVFQVYQQTWFWTHKSFFGPEAVAASFAPKQPKTVQLHLHQLEECL